MATDTIKSKLLEADRIKKEIREAVLTKDVEFPENTPFSAYPGMVSKIAGHLQTKDIEPTAEGGTVYPDDEFDGFSSVTLPAEPNLVPGNIVEGVSVFGVYGTAKAISFDVDALFAGTITELISSVAVLRNYAFYNYTALKTVSLPNLTSMGNYAFHGCSGITSFSAPKLEKAASYGMYNCTSLISFLDDELKIIDAYAFSGCSVLENINLSGVTEIKDYGLQNCKKVTGIGTLKTPVIGAYGCYYLGNTASSGFTYEPETEATIGQYGFQYARITELIATIISIGNGGISDCPVLTKLHAAIIGAIGNYGLAYNYYVNDLNLSDSEITSIGTYAFFSIGSKRSNPSSNPLTMDLRKCKFTTVDQYAFGCNSSSYGLKYTDIYLPDTVTTINTYAFRYANYLNLYMKSAVPPTLSATTCFANATNYKIFVPYNHTNAYCTATNWSSLKANIIGYAPAGTFQEGETLPTINGEGYALTWYSDAEKTNVITEAPSADAALYCDSGDRVALVVSVAADENTTLTLVDSEGVSYTAFPAYVPLGRSITLDIVAQEGWGNNTTVNGSTVTLPYSVEPTSDISICSNSWEGDIDPIFETASWSSIQKAALAGVAGNFYAVGSTRTVTLKNGNTITLRVANNSGDLYERSDGSMTGFILEFVDLWPTTYYMNPTNTNAGGWDASYMRNTVMPLILEQLPDELLGVIATVKVKSCKSGTDGTIVESLDKLFLPAERELFGSRQYSRIEEWNILKQWQYYAQNNTNAARTKKRNGSANGYWERSAYSDNRNTFCIVNSDGSAYINGAYNSTGIGPGICI